ncbi:SIS domain-containing protein [Scopulibacillus cellulosilyticus]|uniref:SIS domain-containing protein n=1 Tax=Scopulibacillus cellulosilyticus TaxID=2665665 RepID=A0ABW2PRN6_9BACL
MTVSESITYKEIKSQPKVWKKVIDQCPDKIESFVNHLKQENYDEIIFVGCGTSYYLAQSLAFIYSEKLKVRAFAVPASEILFHDNAYLLGTAKKLFHLISRSGDTSEIVSAAKKLKAKNYTVSAVTCRSASSLAEAADLTIAINEADEESVVMTRSFTSMFITMVYAAEQLAGAVTIDKQIVEAVSNIIDVYEERVMKLINNNTIETFVFLGSGSLYGVANEAMLKMKEMTISNSEVFHPFEYRHGPMSLVSEKVLVTLFTSIDASQEELQLLKEMKGLNGKTLVIKSGDKDLSDFNTDLTVQVNGLTNEQVGLIGLVLVQLMGCYIAEHKGLNLDKPRNLTQVVKL